MNNNGRLLLLVETPSNSQVRTSRAVTKDILEINMYNRLKNPNWWETDQLAIYKHDQGFELGYTTKQLQLSGQSRT